MAEAGSNSSFRGNNTDTGELRMTLVDREKRERTALQIANAIRPQLNVVPGIQVRTRISSGNFGRRGSGGEGGDRLSVEIRGHDSEVANELALQVRNAMLSTPGVTEAQISRQPGLPEMVLKVDRLKAASLGMRVAEVADTMETAIGGRRTSFYREEGDEYDIVVRLREQDRLAIGQVGDIPLRTPQGQLINADSVVRMQRQEGPVEIERVDQERIVFVSGTIGERDLGSIVADLDEKLKEIPRPPGYEFRFGGEYEEQVKAFNDLMFAAILALILVYMVRAPQFESVR
jgi:HAE1 family hydrophobic/amphiphilic exporter-1